MIERGNERTYELIHSALGAQIFYKRKSECVVRRGRCRAIGWWLAHEMMVREKPRFTVIAGMAS